MRHLLKEKITPHQVAPQSIETISLLDIPIWLFINAGWRIWRGIAPANCLGGFASGKTELFGVGSLRVVDHGGGQDAAIPEDGVLVDRRQLLVLNAHVWFFVDVDRDPIVSRLACNRCVKVLRHRLQDKGVALATFIEEFVIGLGLFVEDSGVKFAEFAERDLLSFGRSGDLHATTKRSGQENAIFLGPSELIASEQRFLRADRPDRSTVKCYSELVVDLLSDVEVVSRLGLDNLGVNQKDKSVSGHFEIGSSLFG